MGFNKRLGESGAYFKGGVIPATTLWTLIYNFRVICFCNSWATKTPENQWFRVVYSITNCREGVLHPAEKDIQLEKQAN
jgi:hypothetical protein